MSKYCLKWLEPNIEFRCRLNLDNFETLQIVFILNTKWKLSGIENYKLKDNNIEMEFLYL